MSVRLRMKIPEGPARGLCGSCEHSRIMIDDRDRSRVLCEENHPPFVVDHPIKSCTDYQAKGTLSKWQMERVAWKIQVDKKGKVGFNPPHKKDDDA